MTRPVNLVENATITSLLDDIKKDRVQKVVVGAVIQMDNQKILLVRRVSDDFMGGLVEIPSGTVDPGEKLLEALSREVIEETGLTIQRIEKYVTSFDYKSGSGKKTRQLNFLVTQFSGDVVLNPAEHDEFYIETPGSNGFNMLNISEKTRGVIFEAFDA